MSMMKGECLMRVQPAAHLHDGSGFAVLQEELTVLHERVQVDQEALQAAEEIVSHRLPRPPHQLLHLLRTDHFCSECRDSMLPEEYSHSALSRHALTVHVAVCRDCRYCWCHHCRGRCIWDTP